jgi:putative DNA methylase
LILKAIAQAVSRLPGGEVAEVVQRDARARVRECSAAAVSTDPPYYDNISYADLSDFFFVWLRRNLSDVWPDECATLLTPKTDELIANQYRAGSRVKAEQHFESGMAEFMAEVAKSQAPDVPATIYYAYKATETSEGEIRSTGWDTFLQGVLDAGMQVTATWPMRTELGNRLLASKSNALASSIVLACRPRLAAAPLASRGEFIGALRRELPDAVRLLQSGNIAPVDLAQSTIGPGVKVFSRYAKVVEADGSSMSVSNALAIINDVLGEVLDGEEAELDRDTRFAVAWYTQNGYSPGRSGDADGQARAKNTSLAGIEDAGIGEARAGQFRLFKRLELNPDWDPISDDRRTVWEATQYLVAALERSETEASELLHRMGGYADRARQLAYVLFQKATDKGWADEAAAYNGLITAWPALQAMDTGDNGQQSLL